MVSLFCRSLALLFILLLRANKGGSERGKVRSQLLDPREQNFRPRHLFAYAFPLNIVDCEREQATRDFASP